MAETKVGSIGVPSMSGIKDAFKDFGIGAIGGLAYMLTRAMFGTGIIGLLAAPVLAGSLLKGTRGTVLATIAGFMLFAGLGGGSSTASASSGSQATI